MKQYRHLLLNSTVAYVLAFLVTVTIHEFGHGIAALLVGQHPIIYGVKEHDASGTNGQMAFIAAAGPLLSLLVGVLFLQIERTSKLKNVGRQLILWLGLMGLALFFGYLMTAPFFTDGDIAVVISKLSCPDWIRFISFAIGAYGFVITGRIGLRRLLRLINPAQPLRPQLVSSASLPWILGSVVILIGSLPWLYTAWPIAVVTTGLFTLLVSFFARGTKVVTTESSNSLEQGMTRNGTVILLIVMLFALVIEATILRSGIHL